MDKVLAYLQKLQLSEVEAQMYLALLKAGSLTVRELAEKVDIKRTTAYLPIEKLMDKGLVSKATISSHTRVTPIQPTESIGTLVNDKAQKATEAKEKLPEIIKSLHTKFPEFKETSHFETKHYSNINGIKQIYEEALEADEVRTYIKLQEPEPIFSSYLDIFKNAFTKNKKLTVREIIYDFLVNEQELQKLVALNSRYEYRLMPKTMKIKSEDILIYDGKIAIISFKDKAYISGTVLQNRETYDNFVEFFDYIWKTLPKK